ncbi:nuclear egress lamina protein [Beluga whale alphaherpesvirus 1]|uniref:Nuclear egress lamina protein n=1 Tax=Beluga whale alphaherpesvirus 1 TaxID=1434720 RepID=A0A286MM49_9ALPH|nr:nuclear egress lamina protein [Beluga whale alphaherpesvirus 1]ASW27075.1 nuclear egress lamina protein [Beluga whale alphaherpesvirus 1]
MYDSDARASGSARSRSRALRRSLRALRRRRGSGAVRRAALRDRYAPYFRYLATSPADEIAAVREISVPVIKTAPISLPFDLADTVADNCVSLSGLGYYLGIGGCCPSCAVSGEPRLKRADRASLTLAYVQLLNNIYEYRAFLASVAALAEGADAEDVAPADARAERRLGDVLAQPELFFAYHVLRDAGLRDVRALFYRDPAGAGYAMYAIFPGKAVHLHHRVLDHLLSACPGYRVVAHVWQTMFLLVVRKTDARQANADVPAISARDLYCKMSDLNFDGELLLEYRRLYAAFDSFPLPE